MKKISSAELLDQLQAATRQMILTAHEWQREDPAILQQQPIPGSWSAAQAIEHLNAYHRHYLPVLQKAMHSSTSIATPVYTASWLGNKFTHMMAPTEKGEIKNKMKAMKGYVAPPEIDSAPVLKTFIAFQQQKLELLETAREKNLQKIRIPVSVLPVLRLQLGDMFRFLIAHEQRHILQAQRAQHFIRQSIA